MSAMDVQALIEQGMQRYRLQRSPLPPPPEIRTIQPSQLANSHTQSSIVYNITPPADHLKDCAVLQSQHSQEIEQRNERIRQLQSQIEQLARELGHNKTEILGKDEVERELQGDNLVNKKVEDSTETSKIDFRTSVSQKPDDSDEEDVFFVKKARFLEKMKIQEKRDAKLTRLIGKQLGTHFHDLDSAVKALFG